MLSQHLHATIAYYDCLDYPLTAFEAWKHCLVLGAEREPPSFRLSEAIEALEQLRDAGRIETLSGFFFLPGRHVLVPARLRDEKTAVAKLKRARRLIGWLGLVPFVRMIGITGSLSMKKGDAESDWDFFVVLRTGRMWIGRTCLTGFLHLIGKRRHGAKIANRACLNYYLTEAGLEILTKDIFAAHEYRFLLPIFDTGVAQRFELANSWIRQFKPNFALTEMPPRFLGPDRPVMTRVQRFLERLLDIDGLERWLSGWQRKKIAANPKSRLAGSFIVATDTALIFLPRPKGPQIFERFKTRLGETAASIPV